MVVKQPSHPNRSMRGAGVPCDSNLEIAAPRSEPAPSLSPSRGSGGRRQGALRPRRCGGGAGVAGALILIGADARLLHNPLTFPRRLVIPGRALPPALLGSRRRSPAGVAAGRAAPRRPLPASRGGGRGGHVVSRREGAGGCGSGARRLRVNNRAVKAPLWR